MFTLCDDHPPRQRPVLRPAALHVPRADHHVVLAHPREDARQVARRVAEVRVHVLQVVVVVLHRVLHGREGRGAEAELARAGAGRLIRGSVARQLVDDLPGAVGRVVVDHQHVGVRHELVDFARSGPRCSRPRCRWRARRECGARRAGRVGGCDPRTFVGVPCGDTCLCPGRWLRYLSRIRSIPEIQVPVRIYARRQAADSPSSA